MWGGPRAGAPPHSIVRGGAEVEPWEISSSVCGGGLELGPHHIQ